MIMVGANAGIIGMSKEHLAISLALSVPFIICITKVSVDDTIIKYNLQGDVTSRLI